MFMSRLKIFLSLFVLLFLSILFWQNREPLSLKLLCPDINQYCLYQTPKLPLAIWMLIFILAGLVTSLIWQLLSYVSTRSSRRDRYSSPGYVSEGKDAPEVSQPKTKVADFPRSPTTTKTKVNPPVTDNLSKKSDWEDDNSSDDWNTEELTQEKVSEQPKDKQSNEQKSYEVRRKPENVQRSGSTYSYKYREADRGKEEKVDRVYDANYKVINPPIQPPTNENPINTQEDEDDEEWI